MENKEYWKKRAEDISKLEFDKTDDYIINLDLEYKEALDSIQKEIDGIYKKYDIENMPYNAKLQRLKILKAQISGLIQDLYSNQQQGVTDLLSSIYKDTYYRNIFEISKGANVAVNFARVDDKAISKILSEKWMGANYSDRIWKNKQHLIKELQTNLTQSFIRGDSIDKTSKIIANRMNVGKARARTLVNTESAYIASKATHEVYLKSNVVKQYEILATLDLHTSKICRRMDGKVFDVSEMEVGKNAPPFHPNCRSTTIPYFDDAVDEVRIARGAEGKAYYVDSNMKYEKWIEKYIN